MTFVQPPTCERFSSRLSQASYPSLSPPSLELFPIGFTIWKDFGGCLRLQGQVYDYRDRYWRVRYSDQNWEELTRRELEQLQR